MTSGTYFNGKRYVSAADFRRPPDTRKPKPPRKTPPNPQPKETTDVNQR